MASPTCNQPLPSSKIEEASDVRHRRNPRAANAARPRWHRCPPWRARSGTAGPTSIGIYRDLACGLAHTRLSIIDLASGQQPMSDEDGDAVRHVQRRDLQLRRAARTSCVRSATASARERHRGHRPSVSARGATARSSRFNGQFAIALVEPRGQHARSRARSARGAAAPPRASARARRLRERGQGDLRGRSRTPARPRPGGPRRDLHVLDGASRRASCSRGVSELRRRHTCASTRPRGVSASSAYWEPRYPIDGEGGSEASLDEAAEALRAALESATALRMLRADVPVGSYLSGGLDSSLSRRSRARANGDRLAHVLAALRRRRVRRDRVPARRWSTRSAAITREVIVSRADIAEVVPGRRSAHAERPLLRTAPAPLLLLSRAGARRRHQGRADRRGRRRDVRRLRPVPRGAVRRFWAREPSSKLRPLLLDRLYPYLARVAGRAARDGARVLRPRPRPRATRPSFAHAPRWRSAQALQRLFAADVRAAIDGRRSDRGARRHPARRARRAGTRSRTTSTSRSARCSPATCSPRRAIACSMAHSVEGRFPFLDTERRRARELAPGPTTSCASSTRSTCSSAPRRPRAARDHRAPEAAVPRARRARVRRRARARHGSSDELSERAVRDAGVFDPRAVAQLLGEVCGRAGDAQVSNADNMALVGVLSTQLLAPRDGAPRVRPQPAVSTRRHRRRPASEYPMNRDRAIPLLHDLPRSTPRARLPDKVAARLRRAAAHLRASSTRARRALAHALVARGVAARRPRGRLRRQHGRDRRRRSGRVLKANAVVLDRQPADQGRQARLPARTTAGRAR